MEVMIHDRLCAVVAPEQALVVPCIVVAKTVLHAEMNRQWLLKVSGISLICSLSSTKGPICQVGMFTLWLVVVSTGFFALI